MNAALEAFRLIGGPCHGQIAELPPEGYDQTWRCVGGDGPLRYALYARDGAVFRFADRVLTAEELADAARGADVTVGIDSREYER